MVPQKAMEQELKGQEKELTDDINNLNKKVTRASVQIHRLMCTCLLVEVSRKAV